MLTIIVILLVLNILLNLAVGILVIFSLGEFGALEKYRFEFGPIVTPDDVKRDEDAIRF